MTLYLGCYTDDAHPHGLFVLDLDPATADPEEFVDAIEKILQLCDMWAERIQGKLHEAGMSEDVNDVFGHPLGHTIFRA